MFDEYHHGYGGREGIVSLIGPSARLGLLQLGMAFLLLLFAAGRRFGNPIYLREGARFRSEYLGSMSSLLRRAKALGVARDELDRKFAGDVCKLLGLPPDAGAQTISSAMESRRPDRVAELASLLHSDSAVDEKSLIALQARRNQLRKELTNSR